MSYMTAKNCFKENVQLAGKDAQLHNLNTGLFQLVQALEYDLSNMKSQLDRLEHDLRQLKNR